MIYTHEYDLHYANGPAMPKVGQARRRWGTGPSTIYDVYLGAIGIGSIMLYGVRILADKGNGEAVLVAKSQW